MGRITSARGFSLLEILVALFLVSFVTLAVISGGGFVGRNELEEATSGLERAHRFALSEAILRNRVVRLHFYLDKVPQEYALEYGPDAQFVLPSVLFGDTESMGISERENYEEVRGQINRQFVPIREFAEENKKLGENTVVIGVGSNLHKTLVSEGEVFIHVYPDGQRDNSFVAMGYESNVAVITTEAFSDEVEINWESLPEGVEDIPEKQITLVQELFSRWTK